MGAIARPGKCKAALLTDLKKALPEVTSGPLGKRAVRVLGLENSAPWPASMGIPIMHAPGGVNTCRKKEGTREPWVGGVEEEGKNRGQTSWYIGRTHRGKMRKYKEKKKGEPILSMCFFKSSPVSLQVASSASFLYL